VKDEDTLEKEAKQLLVSYANDVCKIGLKVEDLEGDDDVVTEKIRAAAENAKFKDILYCAEGSCSPARRCWIGWIRRAAWG
jgi:hypothetical protein